MTKAVRSPLFAACVAGPLLWAAWVGQAASEAPQEPAHRTYGSGLVPAPGAGAFEHSLSKAYLAWSARLGGAGLWAQAEYLTVRALAAGRGETPGPIPILALGPVPETDPALADLRRAGDRLARYLALEGARPGKPVSPALAEAQAAFDCWAALAMDRAPEPIVGECRQAAEAAFHLLDRSAPVI
ncbi:MAG: hypothetical protein ACFB6R_03520 [Alphaproteobacteria bacterium]